MSGKTTGKVWDLKLSRPKQIVLLALADHANHLDEDIRPSVPLVAWMTGYSVNQARRIIQSLVDDGLLVETAAPPGCPKVYKIDFSNGVQKDAYKPRKNKTTPTVKMIDHRVDDPLPLDESPVTPIEPLPLDGSPAKIEPLPFHEKEEFATPTIASLELEPNVKDERKDIIQNTARATTEKTPSNVLPPKRKQRVDEKHEYDDVPKADRLAIIKAWADELPIPPVNPYIQKNHYAAADIFRAGYRSTQVGMFVKAKYKEDYWFGKMLSLEKVGELMPLWLLNEHPIRRVPREVVDQSTRIPVEQGLDTWVRKE